MRIDAFSNVGTRGYCFIFLGTYAGKIVFGFDGTQAGEGDIKNGPKIKIDSYFFVEIAKKILKNQIRIARGGVN